MGELYTSSLKEKKTTLEPGLVIRLHLVLGLIIYRLYITWKSTLFSRYSRVITTLKLNRVHIGCFCSFVLVSSDKLDLTVRVEDEFTYFADGQPLLAGAKVTLRSRLRSVSLTQYTNESGKTQKQCVG